ncbi:MAG: phage tail tube protein [Pseudomonadota bacterium]
MADGKDKKVHIDDGTGTMLEIIGQRDSTLNRGKTANQVKTKNTQVSFVEDAGVSITFNVATDTPLNASQARLLAVHRTEELVLVQQKSDTTGGQGIEGQARVVIAEETDPEQGVSEWSVSIAFDGVPVEGTVAGDGSITPA